MVKNPDANFHTSVFFCWEKDSTIKMGPIWDFDLAMGGHPKDVSTYTYWHIRNSYWAAYLFKDPSLSKQANLFWNEKKEIFSNTIDSINLIATHLKKASINNFKKWDILNSQKSYWHTKAYQSYEDAVDDLKEWIKKRIEWISSNTNK